ncbi:MAG: isochorismatase family cysteine hydrolase [Pseudomonadota bacterium]
MAGSPSYGVPGGAPGAGARPQPGSGVALVVVDMINAMRFPGADAMASAAVGAAEVIADLRRDADRLGVPVVYVNDNDGQWHAERSRIVEACRDAGDVQRRLLDLIAPRHDDYFIIKPQLSGFYATSLEVLLSQLGARRLVMTGMATEICVQFTAADAHMRGYDLWAPGNATASARPEHQDWALQIMRRSFGAEIAPTTALTLAGWADAASSRPAGPWNRNP